MIPRILESERQNWTFFSQSLIKKYLFFMLVFIYGLIFYKMWTNQLALDFYAFHASTSALFQGNNPYSSLKIPYFATQYKMGANLNMPIFIMLCWPLSKLNHLPAIMIWSSISFILGLIAASVAFKLTFSTAFIKQNRFFLYSAYLLLFSTIANVDVAQIGSVVAFLLIVGYDAYKNKRYVLASVLWGIIISIKLFPGLLFFYVLRQRQYKMFAIMAATVIILSVIPMLTYGMDIYASYFKLLPSVPWYGDSWNASIYGFLFRLFVDSSTLHHLHGIQMVYSALALTCLAWYVKQLYSLPAQNDKYHYQFCLTLIMMLLISPFGWIYYFPMLLLPLLITWSQAARMMEKQQIILWFTSLFLLNFPLWNIHATLMPSLLEKLSIGSFWFYGLMLLAYLFRNSAKAEYVGDQNKL